MSDDFQVPETFDFTAETPAQPVAETVPEESLASPFLAKIPPADRAVVARYIKEWDSGVTKKFQSYADRIKAYEALGPQQEVQQYVNLVKSIQQDPESFFRTMWEALANEYPDDFEAQLARILQVEEAMMSDNGYEEQEYGEQDTGVPNQQEVMLQNMAQELEEMRAWREQQELTAAQAEESRQLDTVLTTMHTRYGQFDDNWILVRLAEHGDPDRAVKEWNQMLGRYSQSQKPQPPKTMGGSGGGVPSGQVDPKTLRGKDRRDVVANMLAAMGE